MNIGYMSEERKQENPSNHLEKEIDLEIEIETGISLISETEIGLIPVIGKETDMLTTCLHISIH